ncbi:MAG: conjugal transfer protein TraB [Novosphingobium sp. 17-62-19]|uniref:TrbI/VirB10 family protein n=1 Tax=Novosphingobium sp. 17-62-19 TaxID=1970406 RepID=UPI000BCD8175|nr:TrbI/VirB10 family protein [Novosphingobium sp. 17-62-19]OZA19950.1 MAG: conjugal transfer protein TraB [Novosphingobium sp. 17-62-19]HQS96164.1 TrbI/VirB10 family protein [Novosphingobium sp.]
MIWNPWRRAENTAVGTDDLRRNLLTERRQKLLFYGVGGTVAVGAMAWILQPNTNVGSGNAGAGDDTASNGEVKVSTDDMVNRNMSEREWMAMSEGQMEQYGNQIRGLEGNAERLQQLEAQIQSLQGEKSAMAEDGTRVLSAYEAENQQLRAQIESAQSVSRAPVAGPTALYGPTAPGIYQPPQTADGQAPDRAAIDAAPPRTHEIKLVAFGPPGAGTAERITPGKTTSFTDSANYLPPNSIARARVVVGVDATTSVRSQNDPLPVVLRITGPARSVYADGRLLRTQIEGCMVNGAATGDLSSEKVYVRLQRMTCPQPGGRFAVSEVKGFIAFGGKTGVRGRVVSREGGLVGQAFLAGLAGGFGRGFSLNTETALTGSSVNVNGQRDKLSLGEIAQGGVGSGAATSADQVSKYLIERAEQYQPVIEMPTGIDVEIVFLDGVFIRN